MMHEANGWLAGAVVDAVVEAYVDWRQEAAEVARAERRWNEAPRAERALAFGAVSAALDQEERAAARFEELVTCARRAVRSDDLRVAA